MTKHNTEMLSICYLDSVHLRWSFNFSLSGHTFC